MYDCVSIPGSDFVLQPFFPAEARLFAEGALPSPLAFDHAAILADYFRYKKTGQRPL